MPGACCTRGLVCECVRRKCTRAYRYSRSNPAFPAQWFDGLCRAPRRRIPLASVAAGLMAGRSGWIDVATGSLAPATGVGTTRFCRTHQRRSSCALSFTHGEIPPCEHASRRRRRVHRIPPRVRDDRDTPLLSSRDSQEKPLIWGQDKAEYICRANWTAQINLNLFEKLDFSRTAFSVASDGFGQSRNCRRDHLP
jgi:hypothetical protein